MALRDIMDSGGTATSGPSALAGLPSYWDQHSTPPKIEWEKWWGIFIVTVAVNAKHSISVHELLRTPTEARPRQAALLNNTNEQAAERKIVSILFLSLGVAGRKNLTDKYPHMTIATASLHEIKTNCEDIFQQPRNRTLDRFKFFSRKQLPNETLRQFWNALTGLAARCEFEQQTEGLIMDTFIQNMHNKTVRERLCTDPKEQPQEALRFAIVFEEGIIQQQSFTSGNVTKKKLVCAIENKNKNPCTRCGWEFNQNHLSVWKANGENCRNWGVVGHFMRMCKIPKSGSFRGSGKSSQRGNFQRVNLIGQTTDQSEDSSDENDNVVLHLAGNTGTPPFMLKGKINKQPFQTMIDSGSPITIFTKEDIRQITKSDVLLTRPLPKNEQYKDYNGKPLNLLGYITVDVQVGRRKHQEGQTHHCQRWKTIFDWPRLVNTVELQSSEGIQRM